MVLAYNTNSGRYDFLTVMLVSALRCYVLRFGEKFPTFSRTIKPPSPGSIIYSAVKVSRDKIYIYIHIHLILILFHSNFIFILFT